MHFVILKPTSTISQPKTSKTIGLEQRQALVLRAWEAVSSEREWQCVLEAITHVLAQVIPYDGIAIISFDGVNHSPYAAHIVGHPRREGETLEAYFNRPEFNVPREVQVRPLIPLPPAKLDRLRESTSYTAAYDFSPDQSFPPSFSFFNASIPPVLFGFSSTDRA
jgi:hypothetical protein